MHPPYAKLHPPMQVCMQICTQTFIGTCKFACKFAPKLAWYMVCLPFFVCVKRRILKKTTLNGIAMLHTQPARITVELQLFTLPCVFLAQSLGSYMQVMVKKHMCTLNFIFLQKDPPQQPKEKLCGRQQKQSCHVECYT